MSKYRQRKIISLLKIVALLIIMNNNSANEHYATSRKVARSSPDEMDFLSLSNPSSRAMAQGSTQLLTEMCTRNLHGG
jgi:hypothetical protein